MPTRESLAEILESLESDEAYDESDWGEARRSRPLPLPKPQGGGYAQPRPSPSPVTQTQLQAALARVGKDIQTNADGIKALNTRAAAIAADFEKHTAVVKKEFGELRGSAKSAREMMILPFLLQTPPRLNTTTVTAGVSGTLPPNTAVVSGVSVQPPSPMNTMLPLLLLMGSGGDGSKGSGGGDDTMMMLVLVMMMNQQR